MAAVFAVGLVVLVLGFIVVTSYNAVVALRQRIDKARSNIDVVLKQRYDQLPALVAAVRGLMAFEQDVLTEVARARAAYAPTDPLPDQAATSDATSAAVRRLFAVVEAYPEVSSHENVLDLQHEIERLEAMISDRRELYNDQVYRYNTRIATLPTLALAVVFGWSPREFFAADPEETERPTAAPAARRTIRSARSGSCDMARPNGRARSPHRAHRYPADRRRPRAGGGPRAPARGTGFALVLTSPLRVPPRRRALRASADVIADPDLAEWDYGDLEGRTTADIEPAMPGWSIWNGPWPGGETVDQVGVRADRVIARVSRPRGARRRGPLRPRPHAAGPHGSLVRASRRRHGRHFALGTATIGVLGWERSNPVVETWNEACHPSP